MAFLPVSKERLATVQAAMRGRAESTVPINVRAVSEIGGWRLLGFRDRHFLVPPVPFPVGARLDQIARRLEQINRTEPTAELVDEYVHLCGEIVTIAHQLVRHHRYRRRGIRGRITRWLWRRSRNPFRTASEGEIGSLLRFFLQCRMMRDVRHS